MGVENPKGTKIWNFENDLYKWAISLYALYMITQIWIGVLPKTYIWQLLITFGILCLMGMGYITLYRKGNINRYFITSIDIQWLAQYLLILVFLLKTSLTPNREHLFAYTVGTSLLLLFKGEMSDYKLPLNLLKIGSMIYVLGTLLQYFFTDIFNNSLFLMVDNTILKRLPILIKGNYYPGFGINKPAGAALYMAVGIGIIISFWTSDNSKKINLFALIILVITLIMTGKRSILLWTFVTMYVMYLFFGNTKLKTKIFITLIICVVMAMLMIFIVYNPLSMSLLNRLKVTFIGLLSGQDVSSGRIKIYTAAWGLFLKNPLSGIGWNNFSTLTDGYFSRRLNVHNVYLQLLCETGIFGFILISGNMFYTYYKTINIFNKTRKAKGDRNNQWLGILKFSVYFQTFFLLYCLTENPYYNLLNMLFYYFAVSIVNSYLFRIHIAPEI